MRANTNFFKQDKELYDFKKTYYQTEVQDFPLNFTVFLKIIAGLIFLNWIIKDPVYKNPRQRIHFLKKAVSNEKYTFTSDGFVFSK